MPINKYSPKKHYKELDELDNSDGCYLIFIRVVFGILIILSLFGAGFCFAHGVIFSGMCYAFFTLCLLIIEAIIEGTFLKTPK